MRETIGMGKISTLYDRIQVPDWFVDNGCTLVPKLDYDVESLCRIHDYLYDIASVYLPFDKHEADKGLADQIGLIYESTTIAAIIYIALDAFGHLFYRKSHQKENTPFTKLQKIRRKAKKLVFGFACRNIINKRIKKHKKTTGMLY